jgi:phi LC3 family holin
MKINWMVRIKNKAFWLAIIPAVLLLVQAVAGAFGFVLELGEIGDKLLEIVNAVFVVLSLLGIVADPTTIGMGDSQRALKYVDPRDSDRTLNEDKIGGSD